MVLALHLMIVFLVKAESTGCSVCAEKIARSSIMMYRKISPHLTPSHAYACRNVKTNPQWPVLGVFACSKSLSGSTGFKRSYVALINATTTAWFTKEISVQLNLLFA